MLPVVRYLLLIDAMLSLIEHMIYIKILKREKQLSVSIFHTTNIYIINFQQFIKLANISYFSFYAGETFVSFLQEIPSDSIRYTTVLCTRCVFGCLQIFGFGFIQTKQKFYYVNGNSSFKFVHCSPNE